MEIGKKIQKLRKERGLTQEALAEKIGVSAQAVSKWENGYSCPDISVLPTLASILGVSTDELLGDAEHSNAGTESAPKAEFVEDPDKKRGDSKTSFSFDIGRSVNLFEKLWFGLFVIAAGVLLILSKATDILPCSYWSVLWPTAIICIGASGITKRRISAISVGAALIGVYFLLDNLKVIPESFSGTWFIIGAILVVCGILTLIPRKKTKVHVNSERQVNEYSCDDGYLRFESCFGDNAAKFEGGTFNGGNVEVSFGAARLDLTAAASVADGAVLAADVSFGSLEIVLPRNVRIASKRDTSFGSVNVKGKPDDNAAYELKIDSDVSFGSVEIIYV